jgi:hypothetical protein
MGRSRGHFIETDIFLEKALCKLCILPVLKFDDIVLIKHPPYHTREIPIKDVLELTLWKGNKNASGNAT